MTAPKHTPGPWEAMYGHHQSYDHFQASIYNVDTAPRGKAIARLPELGDEDTDAEFKANARLIVASPDLLAALRGVLAEPYGCTLCDSGKPRNAAKGHQPDCPYEAARAAIAKAEGKEAGRE